MITLWNLAALLATAGAIALLLLTLRQQRWLAQPLPRVAQVAAALAAGLGLACCVRAHGAGAGTSTWLVLVMTLALLATIANARRAASSQ